MEQGQRTSILKEAGFLSKITKRIRTRFIPKSKVKQSSITSSAGNLLFDDNEPQFNANKISSSVCDLTEIRDGLNPSKDEMQAKRQARHSSPGPVIISSSSSHFYREPVVDEEIAPEVKRDRQRSGTPYDSSGISFGSTDSGLNSSEALAAPQLIGGVYVDAAKVKANLGRQRKHRAPTINSNPVLMPPQPYTNCKQETSSDELFSNTHINRMFSEESPSLLDMPLAHGTPVPAIVRKNMHIYSAQAAQMGLLASQIQQKANQRADKSKDALVDSSMFRTSSPSYLTDSSIGSVYMNNLSKKKSFNQNHQESEEDSDHRVHATSRQADKQPVIIPNLVLRKMEKTTEVPESPSNVVTFRFGASTNLDNKVASWKSELEKTAKPLPPSSDTNSLSFVPPKLRSVEKRERTPQEEDNVCPQLIGLRSHLRHVNVKNSEERDRPQSLFVPSPASKTTPIERNRSHLGGPLNNRTNKKLSTGNEENVPAGELIERPRMGVMAPRSSQVQRSATALPSAEKDVQKRNSTAEMSPSARATSHRSLGPQNFTPEFTGPVLRPTSQKSVLDRWNKRENSSEDEGLDERLSIDDGSSKKSVDEVVKPQISVASLLKNFQYQH